MSENTITLYCGSCGDLITDTHNHACTSKHDRSAVTEAIKEIDQWVFVKNDRSGNAISAAKILRDEVGRLEARVKELEAERASILKLHTAVRIYQDCGRNGDCDNAHIAEDSWPESDFLTCEEGYEYEICFGCCTDGDNNQTRTCVECHDHNAHKPRCGTFALLTNPQGDTL